MELYAIQVVACTLIVANMTDRMLGPATDVFRRRKRGGGESDFGGSKMATAKKEASKASDLLRNSKSKKVKSVAGSDLAGAKKANQVPGNAAWRPFDYGSTSSQAHRSATSI